MHDEIQINGNRYALANDEWRQPPHNVTLAECENAARRLGLNCTGEAAVQRIVDYIRSQGGGPVWGKNVVKAFSHETFGPASNEWTVFFKYACNNCGLLRYKKIPVTRSSTVYFGFPDAMGDSTVFAADGP